MSVTPQRRIISKILLDDILKLAKEGERADGRRFDDYRRVKVATGVVEKAEGSAMVQLGSTRVLTGVKVELGTPYPDTPDEGTLTVNTELVPLASETFEPGPPNEHAITLARFVDRGVRESKAIDTKELCIVKGHRVLSVMIDIYVLDHNGNLVDAAALATLAALATTKYQVYEANNGNVVPTGETRSLVLREKPVATTFAVLGDKLLLDPSFQEEQATGTYISFATMEDGRVCAVQKNGLGSVNQEMIFAALRTAINKSGELRSAVFG